MNKSLFNSEERAPVRRQDDVQRFRLWDVLLIPDVEDSVGPVLEMEESPGQVGGRGCVGEVEDRDVAPWIGAARACIPIALGE